MLWPLRPLHAFNTIADNPIWAATLLILLLAWVSGARGDLLQTETLDPTTLGNEVMDQSVGNVTINNVSVVGKDGQIATFTNGLSVPGFIDFDGGVLLSSGQVSNIDGPNTADSTGDDVPSAVPDGDADFDALTDAERGTFDAAYIVIDFTPTGDTITGNFVFASEEYNEYAPPDGASWTPDNTFYDVMAFFVNGVNYSVTAAGDDVSINSVNQTLNSADFVDNDFGDFDPAATPVNIAPDGFTRTLSWTAPVVPDQSNILKFGVADGGDAFLDSWLLLERYSFRVLNSPVDVDLALSVADNGLEVVADESLEFSALVENVGVLTASREIRVDFDLPDGVTINGGAAASVAETGPQALEWSCQSSSTTPQSVSCFSTTPLFNTLGNSQTSFSFQTDPVDVSLIGTTLSAMAVVSTTDNDLNATNDQAVETALVVASDTSSPTVVIGGLPAVTGSLSPIPVTLTFNEDVSELDLSGIQVINGTVSNIVVVDARTVTLDVAPDGAGDLGFTVLAGAVQDSAGNDNLAIGPVVTVFDASSPVLTFSNTPTGTIGSAAFTVDLDFSESVNGFDASDILISNGLLDQLVMLDADSWQATITPDGSNDIIVSVLAGAAQSVANGTDSGAASITIDYNEGAPVATLTSSVESGYTQGPFTVTVTWSELVNGFESGDISVTNGIVSNVSPTTSPGQVYTFDVTPIGEGVVSVSVLELAVVDAGGIGNPPTVALTTIMDTQAPTISVDMPVLALVGNADAYSVSGDCTVDDGLVDISLTGAVPPVSSVACTPAGRYNATFDVTALSDGIDALDISVTQSDAAGNISTPATATANKDTSSPTVSLQVISSDDTLNALEYNSDLLISGTTSDIVDGQTVMVTVNGQIYTTTVNADAFALTVPAVDVQQFGVSELVSADVSTALGLAAPQATRLVNVDLAPPSVPEVTSILANTVNPVITGIANLAAGDQLSVSVGGVTYTVAGGDLAVDAEGNWTLTIPAGNAVPEGSSEIIASITDASGNVSTDTSSDELVVDTTPPAVSITTPIAIDDQINAAEAGTVIIAGQTEPDTAVELIIDDGINSPIVVSLTSDGSGAWAVARSELDRVPAVSRKWCATDQL